MVGESGLTLARLEAMLVPHRLEVLGGFAVGAEDEGLPKGTRTRVESTTLLYSAKMAPAVSGRR